MGTISRTQGQKLQVGDGASTETFTSIAGITDWNDNGTTRETGDNSDLDSTHMEKYGKLPDFGAFNLTLNIEDGNTEHQQLIDDANSATAVVRNYKATRADGTTERKAFTGFVSNFNQTGTKNDHITATVEIVLTAAPTDTI